jgi:LytS/YehU family sensor histidine kinase
MTGKGDRAEDMIQTLSNFYRHSLAEDTTSDVYLADEFALQQHYLEIEAIRFPDRLVTEFDLPDDLTTARIPGMILQPLVENSVKYAVAPLSRPVVLSIKAREDYGRLAISVSDDGPGANDLAEHGFGIGLANVRDRLKARFGDDATITAGPTETGYCTEIRVPLRRHD